MTNTPYEQPNDFFAFGIKCGLPSGREDSSSAIIPLRAKALKPRAERRIVLLAITCLYLDFIESLRIIKVDQNSNKMFASRMLIQIGQAYGQLRIIRLPSQNLQERCAVDSSIDKPALKVVTICFADPVASGLFIIANAC